MRRRDRFHYACTALALNARMQGRAVPKRFFRPRRQRAKPSLLQQPMNPRLFSLQSGADSIKKLGVLLVFGACGLFCPLSGSAAAPSQPDALTAASFSSDFPAEHMPLKVGVVKYVRPSPYEPIVEATIGALKRVFGTANVIVTHYDLAGLSQAIREGEVDLFLSSSGFYVRMERYGARAAATVASNSYPNPNHNDG